MPNRIKTWGTEILTSADLNGEFNNIYEGTISRTGGVWGLNNNIPLALGTAGDAHLAWNTTQTTSSPTLGLGTGNSFLVIRKGDMGYNFAFPSQTNPALVVFSGSQNTSRYISLQHNQSNGIVNSGTGSLLLQVSGSTRLTVSATGISAADIGSGTLAVARGGTNIASYTTGNYIRASGATTLAQRTPGQVLSDVGGVATIASRTDIWAHLSTNQTATSPKGKVAFGTEISDPTNEWHTTNYDFTAAVDGFYLIQFGANISGGSDATLEFELVRDRGGTTILRQFPFRHLSASPGQTNTFFSITINANAGDKYYVNVLSSPDTTLSSGASATSIRIVRLY